MSTPNSNRVRAGVTEGGQFTTGARAEPPLALQESEGEDHTTVMASGPGSKEADRLVAALQTVPGLGHVQVHILPSRDLKLSARVNIHGSDYLVDRTAWVRRYEICESSAGMIHLSSVPDEAEGDRLGRAFAFTHHGVVMSKVADDAAQVMAAEFGADRYRHQAGVHRVSGMTELGFPIAGDNIKVQAFDDDDQSRLVARSASNDGLFDELTDRQSTIRLNKALDSIGPDRPTAKEYVRRYLHVAQVLADEAISADPLLSRHL